MPESKGIISAQKLENVKKTWKHGIALKRVFAKLPFHSRIYLPNSTPQSGSFGSRLLDPALVHVSVSRIGSVYAVFTVSDHFAVLTIRPDYSRILARTVSIMTRRASNGQNGSMTARMVNNGQY